MEFNDYVGLLRRSWLTVVMAALLGVIVAGLYTYEQSPTYQSTAKAYVSTRSASNVGDLSAGTLFTQQAVKGYAEVAVTSYVLGPVKRALHLQYTEDDLERMVTASAPDNTGVLEVSVAAPSPADSANIANAVTRNLESAVINLAPNASEASAGVKLTQIQVALPPTQATAPKPLFDIALGLLFGLLAGFLIAVAREAIDTRLRTARDIEAITDTPILGAVPFDGRARTEPLALGVAGSSVRAEAFRSLRTSIDFLDFAGGAKAFVVTSSVASEGKSSTAANLAIALSETGRRVVLIDADLRRPSVARYFGLEGAVGLTDLLRSRARIEEVAQAWGGGLLSVVPSGPLPPNPNELLQSDRMQIVIAELRTRYDVVIFDTPPLLAVSDGAILAKRTDGALYVAGFGRAKRSQVRVALSTLEQLGVRVLGVILTLVPRRGPDADGYAQYGYGYQQAVSDQPREQAQPSQTPGRGQGSVLSQ